ncbi:MAG: transketolase C-terminal domain-containing protein [Candidatus Margulisiibacteriota bacterium]
MSEMLATRDAYGKTLVELGKETKDVVVLDADLSSSTRTAWFAKEFPERFINAGVAEQNLIGMAAGLALSGKTVFASSFAMFCTGRPWEMIRNSIAYPNLNVKIVSTHAGITVGEDGASHQANEDIAIMRAIPNMTVIVPGDAHEAAAVIRAAAKIHGPWYIRLSRSATPVINESTVTFNLNDTPVLRKGKDVTIVASGIMIKPALDAADALAKDGIEAEVLNLHTIKPMPVEPIIRSIKKTGLLVTAEEHNLSGGIGSAVAQQIVLQYPVPMEMVGLKDTFGESGTPDELLEKYKLNAEAIIIAVKKGLQRKSA